MSANEDDNEFRHRRNRDEIDQLDARIDRLLLITEAVWQLLAEKTGLDGNDLAERIRHLDQLDGIEDGRRQPVASNCDCGAKVNPKSDICQFCGVDAPKHSVFDVV
ncbi:MAG: hypothetical protein GY724_03760 [Actinomycetia bacterium]|nr:hypothetical protein [Actinomycetes bacterium]MCP4226185.1 hypothetical protein [Actinomycetes bacterium]MCP5034429.1 hypothetical protein [Actinomycetes bacterium]